MSDYTPTTDFSAKDALTTGDPEKIILGSDIDVEFDAINTAVATKYDSTDLASQANAEAESSNTVLMTPLRVANWSDYNAGMVGDIQALTDPNADRMLGWDDSAGAVIGFTFTAPLAFNGTGVELTVAGTLPAMNGSALTALNATNLASGSVADARLSSQVVLKDGAISSVDNLDAADPGYRGIPRVTDNDDRTLALTDCGFHINYQGAGGHTITIPANASVAFPQGTAISIVNLGSGSISIAITTDTLRLAGTATTGTRTLGAGGLATILKADTTTWLVSGAGLS